jgi:hypothetical protein
MVALGLATFALFSIGAMITGAMLNKAVATEITTQTVDASSEMERLLSLPWNDVRLRAGGDLDRSVEGYSLDPVNDDANRFVRWQIVDEGTDFKRISLVAGMRSSALATREVRIDTFRRRTEVEE